MLEVNEIINECYILRRRVGEDCFSEWWQASAIFVASNFLIRFIKPEYLKDDEQNRVFFDMAKKRITIVSPAILSLIEVDRFKRRFFVASEYDDHKHLKSVLDSGRRFSVEHTCRMMMELAEGVGTFHLRGEVFGVLTPECVVVHGLGDRIDELKLLMPGYDPFFRLVPEDKPEGFKDTWGYASPEMKRGNPTTLKSDMYSLGVLLFRLLTGKIPYGSRSGIKVRNNSASPAHVAAALARRGVPRELTMTTVRALRKNPDLRHDDVVSFINDLRRVLEARREAWMKAGEVDPIADLATLNLKKAKADAREIVRSLETVNYFRYMYQQGEPETLVPIEIIEANEEILELEELEAEEQEDNDSIATEAYVEAGYLAAQKYEQALAPKPDKTPVKPPREAAVESKPPVKMPEPETVPEPLPKPQQPAVEAPVDKKDTVTVIPAPPATIIPVAASTAVPQAVSPADTSKKTGAARKPRSRKRAAANKSLVWRHTGGTPHDVAAAITQAAGHARDSQGIVKFIEDPKSGEPATIVNAAIASLESTCRVIDLGGFSRAISLGTLSEALARLVGPMPGLPAADTDNPSTNIAATHLAESVCALAEAIKPLVIVARNAEQSSRSVHHFMVELARLTPTAPVCAFFFFNAGKSPSWHILATLDGV
jgi:outer membrane biosynthesis protein TonB